MIRLRDGKCQRRGPMPGANSETSAPLGGDALGELAVLGRVADVDAGSEDGDRAARRRARRDARRRRSRAPSRSRRRSRPSRTPPRGVPANRAAPAVHARAPTIATSGRISSRRPPADEQQRRRRRDLRELVRVLVVGRDDRPGAEPLQFRDLRLACASGPRRTARRSTSARSSASTSRFGTEPARRRARRAPLARPRLIGCRSSAGSFQSPVHPEAGIHSRVMRGPPVRRSDT